MYSGGYFVFFLGTSSARFINNCLLNTLLFSFKPYQPQWTVPAFNAETYKLNLWSLQKGEPGVMKQVKAQKK